ncbi:MAG: hypothetical protein KF836_13590 [Fimbriimonadaceae bacterium]|nr:hypothetical protein [Fimbriimonadaceae bacterium]
MSGQYDADAPEGEKSLGTQYVGKKDIKWIFLIAVVLAAMLVPLYKIMKVQSDEASCTRNMKSIAASIQQYAEINDKRFPPIYEPGENGAPVLFNGKPITWAGLLTLSSGTSFKCPAAEPDEIVRVNGSSFEATMWTKQAKKLDHIELTYGMLAALNVRAVSDVANEDETILISETSNNGAQNVYNPLPFKLSNGEVVPYDGFSIGYDTSEFLYDDSTKYVTRLAFRNSAGGNFSGSSVKGRHKEGSLHVIFVDGHRGRISPERAAVIPGRHEWIVR